jgi:hypothetical protein
MGNIYNKHIKGTGSGILQTAPNKNEYGQTQNELMNKKGGIVKTAETNFNKLRTAFKGFNFDANTAKRFNLADSTNISNLDQSYKKFNKSADSINKVNKDYADEILPNDSSNKMLSPESTPLLQGAYERGDAYVEDYASKALMSGLQSLQQNVSRQFTDPGAKGKRQANRVDRREKRMTSNADLNTKEFKAKTAKIKGKSEANIKTATINQRYKEWMINRNNKPTDYDVTNKLQETLLNGKKSNIDPATGKPYKAALTENQSKAKKDVSNVLNNLQNDLIR